MHTCVRRFHFFFFGVCDVLELLVVMCTLLFSMVTAVYTARTTWSHGISSAPPRVEVLSGLVRTARQVCAEQAVPQGRSRSFKTVNGGGAPE